MTVLRLYPGPQQRAALQGLYLELNLHRQAADGDVLIYANYIASVDGRISVRHADSGEFVVPEAIANKRDWRLYQELAAQADVLIVSARYFRQLHSGNAQALLPVGPEPEYADLRQWRRTQGLKAQPDVLVLSSSLDISPQALEKVRDRVVSVCTSEQGDQEKIAQLQALGVKVIRAGRNSVDGKAIRQLLIEQGYRSACMIAGPKVHRTLVAGGVLNRLFLTTHFSLLGGDSFHTILAGESGDAAALELRSLFLDQSQLFAQYALK